MTCTYVGDPLSHHLIVQAGDLSIILISIATQLESQGPVRYHHRPTNQLENRQKILVLLRRSGIVQKEEEYFTTPNYTTH